MKYKSNSATLTLPAQGRLKIIEEAPVKTSVIIGKEGFSGRAIFILSVIIFWLILIIAWAFMLFQYGIAWSFMAIPFFALGIYTLYTVSEKMNSHQKVEITETHVLIQKFSSNKAAYVELPLETISDVSLVEGTYQTLAGISRKGVFPAFISEGKAFGIGELCTTDEKKMLDNIIKSILE